MLCTISGFYGTRPGNTSAGHVPWPVEDWDGLRDRVSSAVPGGWRSVAAVDAIAETCSLEPLPSRDLVHETSTSPTPIATPDRIWVAEFEPDGKGGLTRRDSPVAASSKLRKRSE